MDLTDILSVEAVSAPASSAKDAAPEAQLPHSVVLQLRSKTKDRMLSGHVNSRTFACAPGTEQAARLHAAIRNGLLDLSTRVGLVRSTGASGSGTV